MNSEMCVLFFLLGITSLPQQLLPFFENYNKLVLWLGNEIGSWDIAKMFSKKLNEKRCYFVRPTEKQSSPSEALKCGQDLKSIISAAQPIWHQSITTFSSLREDVLSDLQNNDKVTSSYFWLIFIIYSVLN